MGLNETKNKRAIGNQYESIACQYLEDNGYTIVDRNYYSKFGEIDIIAMNNQTYIFVEVKYRERADKGNPFEAVTKGKQKRIMKTAIHYIQNKKLYNYSYRFDIMDILGTKVTHYPNAFEMDRRYWR